MSFIDSFHAPASINPLGLGDRLAGLFVHWAQVRETRHALSRLSDRELDDIGLCRGDIDRIARSR